MEIRFLEHSEIDKDKWDQCISESSNPVIYANSFYLDVVCPDWKAFIYRDYEAVFPLPVKSKMGIPYVAHPLFAQQLGTFARSRSEEVNEEFIRMMKKKFRRHHLKTNSYYKISDDNSNQRLNLVLDLKKLDAGDLYNQNTKRNTRKFRESELEVLETLNAATFVNFKKENSAAVLKNEEWQRMEDLINAILEKNLGYFRAVYLSGELISAVFFVEWKRTLYYLFSASDSTGKEMRASFGIVDSIIHEKTESCDHLDFEGSENENIARFFRGFGAEDEIYFEIKRAI